MSSAKKIGSGFEDPVNAKIQRKFDLVFSEKPAQEKSTFDENTSSVFNDTIDFDTGLGDDMVMQRSGNNGKKEEDSNEHKTIDLDFSLDDETPPPVAEKMVAQNSGAGTQKAQEAEGFSLDFDFDAEALPERTEVTSTDTIDSNRDEETTEGFSLDSIDDSEMEFDEATKKTVVVSPEHLTNSNLADFSIETTASTNSSADMMSTEEAKANIESTIKDILRPKFEGTKETVISDMLKEGSITQGGIDEIEDSLLDLGGKTPSKGFTLGSLDDGSFSLDSSGNRPKAMMTSDATGDFDIGGLGDESFSVDEDKTTLQKKAPMSEMSAPEKPRRAEVVSAPTNVESMPVGEDAVRVHATIRNLREEREDLLAQIKNLKSETKELEQDNLTLKANLDEAKIEITILRKRHMVELEDLKYRLTISEEKKAIADEKARQADARREKLEQKVRIDFNQVKQREKELESKLELLSMDVDSQVQSRDHKILELRRKIDALEFNMENASIKEQKSLEDKRKLEDRLNKIMKTLRHSIKNLEDDIDHVEEDDDRQKEKN